MGQGQSGPDGPQGMRGPKGIQGDPGLPGDKGDLLQTIDYDIYSNTLLSNNDTVNTISNIIISSDILQKQLLNALSNNNARKISIQNSIIDNSDFVDYIANRLSNEPTYSNKLRGPDGESAVSDSNMLSKKIMSSSDERNKLIKSLTFYDAELEEMILNNIGNANLEPAITNSTDMAKKVASIVANNQTVANSLKGADGDPGAFEGSYDEITNHFHRKLTDTNGGIIWCGDNEYCYFPKNVYGIKFNNNSSIKSDNNKNVTIKTNTLNVKGNLNMNTATINDRLNTLALYFPNNEMLWPTENSKTLNIGGVKLNSDNMLEVNSVNFKNPDEDKYYSIKQEGDNLVFKYDGNNMFYITPQGGGVVMFNRKLNTLGPAVSIGTWRMYTTTADLADALVIGPVGGSKMVFRDPANIERSNRYTALIQRNPYVSPDQSRGIYMDEQYPFHWVDWN